jgi:signal transduction histidine kinase
MRFLDMSLHETLGDTLKALALKAHEKGIELLSDIEPTLPDKLIGDPVRLRQVIINLVGNAIKFTSKGEVVLSVQMQQRNADSVVLHFAVRDTGIGIPADKLSVIFEAFSQADGSITRKYGGTGLGLTISTRLVQLMQVGETAPVNFPHRSLSSSINVAQSPVHFSRVLTTRALPLLPSTGQAHG